MTPCWSAGLLDFWTNTKDDGDILSWQKEMRVECTILPGSFWGGGAAAAAVVVVDEPEAGIAVVAQPKAYSDWEKERTTTAFKSISQNAIQDIHLAWFSE